MASMAAAIGGSPLMRADTSSFPAGGELGASGRRQSTDALRGREITRYLDFERIRGDISAAYPPTVNPAATESTEEGRTPRTTDPMLDAASRAPFAERWVRHGAPDRGSLFGIVSPHVLDRLPTPDVLASPLMQVEMPVHLFPGGTAKSSPDPAPLPWRYGRYWRLLRRPDPTLTLIPPPQR